MFRGSSLIATICLAGVLVCQSASAQQRLGHRLAPTFSFGSSGTLYGLGRLPVPPYFAIHPPVYFSQRVYRSYGRSPFISDGVAVAPRRLRARVVMNSTVKKAAQMDTQPAPLANDKTAMIVNPFVTRETLAQTVSR